MTADKIAGSPRFAKERLTIVDGHNDLVLKVWQGETAVDLDLVTAAAAGFAGGFFALFVPDDAVGGGAAPGHESERTAAVARVAEELAATLEGLDVTIARRIEDFEPGRIAAIMHLEGAEPIAADLSNLHRWYARGLRSLGLVWSRPNAFAEGVPFAFPASPDTGPGLTDAGRRLVRACNWLGIVIDVSHLNELGFWDIAESSEAPLVATHSNAHALSPSSRNLTDEQLDAIGASGGVVGINFGTAYLRADGADDPATPMSEIVRHVEYVARRIGVDHVAFGSDFDGITIPAELGGVAGLPALVGLLRAGGFDDEAVAKITHANWLRVLDRTWRPWARYFDFADQEPRSTLIEAMARFPAPGLAVDLGCGIGRDTERLLAAGWSVIAVDRQAEAIERLTARVSADARRLTTQVASFEDASWPECDLVNASFALPFCQPDRFAEVWGRVVDSIGPGGRFAGQLLGERDEWAGTGITTLSGAEVRALLEPFEIERLDEIEEDGSTITGKRKHWHLFHVVARKR